MAKDKWLLLSRLRTAVKKVRVLINFNVHRWRLATMIGRRSMASQRRFSFNDRPGLIAAYDDEQDEEEEEEEENNSGEWSEQEYYSAVGSSSSNSRSSGISLPLQRTTSYPNNSTSTPDRETSFDVDQRAEMFINNFRRQLQMERQVSLQIRYSNRANSFNWRSP